MNAVVKKVLKTFSISFLGVYVPYLAYLIILFLLRVEPQISLPNLIDEMAYPILLLVFFAFFLTVILYTASLIDKRVLNKWFALSLASSFSIMGIISQFMGYIRSYGN